MKTMRFLVLLLIPLFSIKSVSAEIPDSIGSTQFCCVYQHWIKTTDLDGDTVTDRVLTILEVGDNLAKYGDFSAYQGQRPSGNALGHAEGSPSGDDVVAVYQDFPQKGTLTVREGLLPNFYVYEEASALEWKFVEGTDSVLGYPCNKAITEYGGRTWIAYYSEEIPSVNGPWKLTGLPGLILKAESGDGIHGFVAQVVFNLEAQKISLDKEERDVEVGRDKFISLRNRLKTDEKWAKNAGYYLAAADIKNVTIVKENNKAGLTPGMNINGISLPLSGGFGHLFQPLELK